MTVLPLPSTGTSTSSTSANAGPAEVASSRAPSIAPAKKRLAEAQQGASASLLSTASAAGPRERRGSTELDVEAVARPEPTTKAARAPRPSRQTAATEASPFRPTMAPQHLIL
eukprot:CAMPEP_0115112084 /NCGR_PEP_ID=MMETSP0227-20121206/40451_1 /TAXON_ID=89957 /ORGANISM="Polarella glacialis, Strain CCMP 1383" /LENGTH=112 /DNA_ID=CAMNT_0002511627 /DNA_START=49 /DNA_END=384 /DNA_ORIENTATION=+